jgi:nucleotide-binding universal stress UspA family protein
MKVLVPLDGSPTAAAVLPAVQRLVELIPGTEIHLLTVLDPRQAHGSGDHEVSAERPSAAGSRGPVLLDPLPRIVESHGEAMERLDREAQEALTAVALGPLAGVSTVSHVLWARNAAGKIVAVAAEVDADAIAMATHGHSGISHLLAGSVTDAVIRTAGRPVIVVGPKSAS